MMLRCTNPKCRACKAFNIQATGDRWEIPEHLANHIYEKRNLKKVKAGKRTKDLEDVKSYIAKCMTCGHKDLVKNMKNAYENPMEIFNTDILCDCGGEIWKDVEVEKLNEPLPEFEPGDAQRKVPVKVKITNRCDRCGHIYHPPI